MSGILIDDKLLICGWYLYSKANSDRTSQQINGDELELTGHSIPRIIVKPKALKYSALKQQFLSQITNFKANYPNSVKFTYPLSEKQ
jgi:hypothetical protein